MKLNEMTVNDVIRAVYRDFDVEIDRETAQHILNANEHGACVWTKQHLIVTMQPELRITPR